MGKKRGPYKVKKEYEKYIQGERYGRLTILMEIPKENRKKSNMREVLCQCDCGNVVIVRVGNLQSGNTTSCGCFEKEQITQRNIEKVMGKRFGRLTVVDYEKDYLNKNRYRYICQCDCGNTHTAIASDLIRGMTRSCGCFRKEFHTKRMTEDITGQKFGELTAIRKVSGGREQGDTGRVKWLFQCSCGKEIIAMAVNVKHGKTKSCGHIGKSIAEYEIGKWLTEHKVNFEYEASFDNLRNNKTKRKYKFDFKIFRPDGSFFLIEHQGMQHFIARKDNENFGKQQREVTDKIKKGYCKQNGITLYETLYNEDYISRLEDIIRNEIEKDGDAIESEVNTV